MKKELKQLQTITFVRSWENDTNEEIELYVGEEKVKIPTYSLINYLSEYTNYILSKQSSTNNSIFGVDKLLGFNLHLGSKIKSAKTVQKICEEIWNNPKLYHDFDGDSYYEFLKYLWIDIDGIEFKLGDIALISNKEKILESDITQKQFDEFMNLKFKDR